MIKVVMLWLRNDKGELLLARRSDSKKQDPGLWGPSVTGKLEPDETFEAALVRETQEELSLEPHSYSPFFLFETDFDHPDGEVRKFKVYFADVTPETAAKVKFDPVEVAEVSWRTIDQIRLLLNSKPGEILPASAFVLWERIFEALQTHQPASAN